MWLAVLVGVLAVGLFEARYEHKANEFDLSKLDSVESASIIYDRYGQVFGKIFIQNREQVPLNQISQNLIDAVIAS